MKDVSSLKIDNTRDRLRDIKRYSYYGQPLGLTTSTSFALFVSEEPGRRISVSSGVRQARGIAPSGLASL